MFDIGFLESWTAICLAERDAQKFAVRVPLYFIFMNGL